MRGSQLEHADFGVRSVAGELLGSCIFFKSRVIGLCVSYSRDLKESPGECFILH